MNQPITSKPSSSSLQASQSDSDGKQSFQNASESLPKRADSVAVPFATSPWSYTVLVLNSHSHSPTTARAVIDSSVSGSSLSLPAIRRKTEKTGPSIWWIFKRATMLTSNVPLPKCADT